MFRWAVILAMFALLVTGGLIAWPQVRGFWLYQRTDARILDVIPTALPDGQVRLSVCYEFLLPANSARTTREWQISWTVADAWFKPGDDPVVPTTQAEAAINRWLDAGQAGRRLRTAFRIPNDPDGAAFILDETHAAGSDRVQIGSALIGVGLVLALWLLRRNH